MAGNRFDKTLSSFRTWAGSTERTLSGDRETDAKELGMLFDLMPDHLGVDDASQLSPGHLTELLLGVYPRKVAVLNREDTADTIPALRDLIAHLADTRAIAAKTSQALERELDEIEPRFADEVMDPANWGMARSALQAMHNDGVDISDSASVDQWIAGQSGDDEVDRPTWHDIDLKESFGIRDTIAPMRLPEEAALAALARTAPLLTALRDLAREVRRTEVRIPDVDPLLIKLATESELVQADGDTLIPGEDVTWLDTSADDVIALQRWDYMFGDVLDLTLEAADQIEPRVGADLDLYGHGISMVVDLFLRGSAGIAVAELASGLRTAAVEGLSPDAAESQWEEWVRAHGDPARLLLGQLEKLSAATVTDEVARLEPLAKYAVAAKLRACGVHIPELPPSDEMTADDLVLVSILGTDDDFESEFSSWVNKRTAEGAARELLTFAAGETAAIRTLAIPIVSRLGAAADPAWREALDRPELRCYAKRAMIGRLAEGDPGAAVPAELKLGAEDLAWVVVDNFGPLTQLDHGDGTMPFDITDLSQAGWTVSNEELFETMARLEHPDAQAVLAMLGKHAADKKTAKAARRAAFKASTRRAARR